MGKMSLQIIAKESADFFLICRFYTISMDDLNQMLNYSLDYITICRFYKNLQIAINPHFV
jgi:hypothetical protein